MRRALLLAAAVALAGAGPARAQNCFGNANKVTAASPLSIVDVAALADLDAGSMQHRIAVSVQNNSTICVQANTANMGLPTSGTPPPKPVSDVEVFSYYTNSWLQLSSTPQVIAVAVPRDTAFSLLIRTPWTDLPGTYRTGVVITAWAKP